MNMGSVNRHTSWWITWRLLSIRVGAQLKAGSESKGQTKRRSLSTWFVVRKRKNEGGGDGQRGDSSHHAIATLLLNVLHHLW